MPCLTDGITLCLAYTKELYNKTNRQKFENKTTNSIIMETSIFFNALLVQNAK